MNNKLYIGFDTSNYTTSLAISDESGNILTNLKCPLPVKAGERGLRQSEAVFAHVKNFPEIASRLRSFLRENGGGEYVAAACSFTPRENEGSYMPCFLVGRAVAETVCSFLDIPLYETSHQTGHIVAAASSACRDSGVSMKELLASDFLALHISGGTTDLLYVKPDGDKIVSIERIGGSADANAGQIVDRIGVRLGFSFPCGPELDSAAQRYEGKVKGIAPSVKGLECNLSGIENKAEALIKSGESVEFISAYVLEYIAKTIEKMLKSAFDTYGRLPVVFAGGVMSSGYIRKRLSKYGMFAEGQYSADNAAGVSLIASLLHNREVK